MTDTTQEMQVPSYWHGKGYSKNFSKAVAIANHAVHEAENAWKHWHSRIANALTSVTALVHVVYQHWHKQERNDEPERIQTAPLPARVG